MTIFSPPATHFLVQASPPALAPLAPHLASTIQPLTVELFPMSSKASADRASTKHTARQISSTFFMVLLFSFLQFRLRPHTASGLDTRRSCRRMYGRPLPWSLK